MSDELCLPSVINVHESIGSEPNFKTSNFESPATNFRLKTHIISLTTR